MVSATFQKYRASRWLFIGATALSVVTATIATTKLRNWANQASEYRLQLTNLKATTNRLDSLEWRVIAKKEIESELKEALDSQRQQSVTTLNALKTTAISPESLEKTIAAYDRYAKSVNQLLQLIEAGKLQEANKHDEEVVDPSYEKLHEIVEQISTEVTWTSETTELIAFWGTILTNLALLGIIGLIFGQYRQTNQRMQLAIVEQEAIRRSEETLKQERAFLEVKVAERTTELEEKNIALQAVLADLRESQAQLIQSEKMSSLGQLVAGVAHEINNPVNFIHGNLSHAARYSHNLLELVELYQAEYNSTPAIQDKIEEIDLEFLRSDVQNLFDSMQMGTNRIQSIVLSLRNFSRLAEAEFKIANVQEGIDNTLVLLTNRLKENGLDIQVVKEYGQLPPIECYAGQLNQVFMNILTNAIDAIVGDPKHQTKSIPSKITIRTEPIKGDQIRITISDNGMGIPETIQTRLFDPFFTTKPVGKGTGLGMSISYRIIAQHQGQLYCQSVVGEGTDFIIEIPIHQAQSKHKSV
jgi:signal transduction histidine kinase